MRWAEHPAAVWILAAPALALAAFGSRPYAGGYNDGSRLATTESLIDRGTLAIDDSVFVHPPPELLDRGITLYSPDYPKLLVNGTLDRVRIDGRFYSDKPMVPAILTAGVYRVLMFFGVPTPGERPDIFCWVATFLTCGLSYAAAVACMWLLGKRAGLTPPWRLVWLVGFALATMLPAYTRQVNSGMPQVAALAGLALLCRMPREPSAERRGRRWPGPVALRGSPTRWMRAAGRRCWRPRLSPSPCAPAGSRPPPSSCSLLCPGSSFTTP